MCQATPVQVKRIDGEVGWVGATGRERPISLAAVAGVAVGDYVICHAGLALERVDPDEAAALLDLLAALEDCATDGADPEALL